MKINLKKWSFLTFPYLRIFLTYLLLFWRMSGWVDLQIFFCISFIQRFSGFPYLLTTFSKDVRLSGPQQFFFPLLYNFTGFPYLLTTFSKDVRLSRPHNFFFVSRLVNFRSEFWHWKWLPEGVTHSSISPQFFFLSHLVDLRIGFWPQKGHPKWSPVEVGWYFCRSTVRVQRAASLENSVSEMLII